MGIGILNFFHTKASGRKKKNKVREILDKNGCWVEDSNEIEQVFVNYYRDLFLLTTPQRKVLT